jgi:hypothetical protein
VAIYAVAAAGDVTGDGVLDVLVGRGEETPPSGNYMEGITYVLSGTESGDHVLEQDSYARISGDVRGAGYGSAAVGNADFNTDGVADVVIAAASEGDHAGALAVLFGPLAGDISVATADSRIAATAPLQNVGVRGALTVGDFDGDGRSDLAAGGPTYATDGAAWPQGAVFVFPGTMLGADVDMNAAAAILYGEAEADLAGAAVESPADLDGDSYADLVIGAYGSDAAADGSGTTYLCYGPLRGTSSLADAAAARFFGGEGESSGIDVGGGRDVTGDGILDLLVGAPDDNDTLAGKAYVLPGR